MFVSFIVYITAFTPLIYILCSWVGILYHKICYWPVMSVSHDVNLSSIQWRASY